MPEDAREIDEQALMAASTDAMNAFAGLCRALADLVQKVANPLAEAVAEEIETGRRHAGR